MTTAAERAALLRAERAEARAAELQQALVSAESDVKRLQHELRVAHGCLASVRVQRRAWRDECVEARKVVAATRQIGVCMDLVRAFGAHVAARRTPASDSDADGTDTSRPREE